MLLSILSLHYNKKKINELIEYHKTDNEKSKDAWFQAEKIRRKKWEETKIFFLSFNSGITFSNSFFNSVICSSFVANDIFKH